MLCLRPDFAGVERTLPGRVGERYRGHPVRICIGAEEVGDDLEIETECVLKKRGLGPRGHAPGGGGSAWARGQASIALSPLSMPFQEGGVSYRWRDFGGGRGGGNALRLRLNDRAECTSERKRGY